MVKKQLFAQDYKIKIKVIGQSDLGKGQRKAATYFPPFNSLTPVKLVLRFFEKRDKTHALCSLSAYVKESGFQNLGSGKVLLVESEIWENISCKIRNPTDEWNPVPGIRNTSLGIQNPRLTWIDFPCMERSLAQTSFLANVYPGLAADEHKTVNLTQNYVT